MLQIRRSFELPLLSQGALPDDRDSPAPVEQVSSSSPVPLHVGTELRLPELRSGGRSGCVPTSWMAVPEAAVNEADGAKPAEHQIRRSGQASVVQAIPDSTRVQGTAKEEFRYSVPASDSCHHSGAGRSIDYVRHLLHLHGSGGGARPTMDFTGGPVHDQE